MSRGLTEAKIVGVRHETDRARTIRRGGAGGARAQCGARVHRTRRRVCLGWFVSGGLHGGAFGRGNVVDVADSLAVRRRVSPQTAAPTKIQTNRGSWAGRTGSRTYSAMLAEGKLPHLAALRDKEVLGRWAARCRRFRRSPGRRFRPGVNPGKHNIFDFLTPDQRTYPAEAQLGGNSPAATNRLRLGQVSVSARQGRRAAAAQEQAVLERPERLRHLQLHHPRADHVSRRRSCAACSSRPCACPTCAARRECFPTSRRSPPDDGEKTGGEVQVRHPRGPNRSRRLDRPTESASWRRRAR